MKRSIRFAPPNFTFFFEDTKGGEAPDITDISAGAWASSSSLIVGCLSFPDGETDLTVSTSANDALDAIPRYDGFIDTPSRLLHVVTSESQILMQMPVSSQSTRVRVWTNREMWPDQILVVVDG